MYKELQTYKHKKMCPEKKSVLKVCKGNVCLVSFMPENVTSPMNNVFSRQSKT